MRNGLMALLTLTVTLTGVYAKSYAFSEGLRFEVAGSFGGLSVDEFSSVFEQVGLAQTIGGIDHTKGVEMAIGYSSEADIGVFVRSGYLRGSADDSSMLTNAQGVELGQVNEEWRLSHVPLSFGVDYRVRRGSVGFAIELAAEMHFLDFSLHSEAVQSLGVPEKHETLGEASVLAGLGGFAVEWAPTAKFALGARTGYRASEDAAFDSFSVDLSGWYFGAYLSVRPWNEF